MKVAFDVVHRCGWNLTKDLLRRTLPTQPMIHLRHRCFTSKPEGRTSRPVQSSVYKTPVVRVFFFFCDPKSLTSPSRRFDGSVEIHLASRFDHQSLFLLDSTTSTCRFETTHLQPSNVFINRNDHSGVFGFLKVGRL